MNRKKIYRAGVIPFVELENFSHKMLFMKPSCSKYGGDKYQIAKGKKEKNDKTLKHTAIREAYEELGFNISNVKQMWKLGVYLGRTTIYVAKMNNMWDFSEFGHETKSIKWLTCEEYYTVGRELHVPIIHDAVDYIINEDS